MLEEWKTPPHDALSRGFSGGCFCGAVQYAVDAPPAFAYLCHCSDCRRINGSAFHVGLAVLTDRFSITAGDPAVFAVRADSGNTVSRFFCPRCAGQLFSRTDADNVLTSVKAGSVTSAPHDAIRPTLQIFYDSLVPWADPPTGLVTFARSARGELPIDAG